MFIHHKLVKSLAVPYLLLNGVQSLFEGLLIHSELLLEIVCIPDPCPKLPAFGVDDQRAGDGNHTECQHT